MDDYKVWCNLDGFGNIVMNSMPEYGNVKSVKYPWNRIPAIKKPYDTNVNSTYAWSPSKNAPVGYSRKNLLNSNCNLCDKNYMNIEPKNC